MASKSILNGYILGLDVGHKRIGVAVASTIAKLPQPLTTVQVDGSEYEQILELVKRESASFIVIGLPRNMSGEETAQTTAVKDFAKELSDTIKVPVEFADESLSSKRADEVMKNNNMKNFGRDALAACFILEEFLGSIDSNNGDK